MNKKKILVGFIIVVLIAGTGIGVWYWQKKKSEREKAELQKELTKEEEEKKPKEEEKKNLAYVSTLEGLNLREEPKVTSKVLAVMVYGSELQVLKEEGKWYQVQYQDKTGWCVKEYTSSEKPPELSIKDVNFKSIAKDYFANYEPSEYILEKILYADLTDDGREEAVLPVRFSGSGACLQFLVYGYKDGYFLTRYFVSKEPENCHNYIKIQGKFIVENYPIYKEGDPNCCPTGGMKYIYYKWNGQTFVVDHEESKAK